MNAPNLPKPFAPSTYDDAQLANIAKAVDMTLNACGPGECRCGNVLQYHGAKECTRCWIDGINRRAHVRREREAMDAQRAMAAGWFTACPRCQELKPTRKELCPDCGGYDREEALLEDESTECRKCGEVEPCGEMGLCESCARKAARL